RLTQANGPQRVLAIRAPLLAAHGVRPAAGAILARGRAETCCTRERGTGLISRRRAVRDKTLTKVVPSNASDASRNRDKMGDLDASGRIYAARIRLRALSG